MDPVRMPYGKGMLVEVNPGADLAEKIDRLLK